MLTAPSHSSRSVWPNLGRPWFLLAMAGCITLLAGCSGGKKDSSGTSGPPVAQLETSRAESLEIGTSGGTISATAIDGTVYELVFPADALRQPTLITMTPVAHIDHLGLAGGMVGAVQLEPSGLVLQKTAVLKIGSASAPPAGMTLTGFWFGDGAAAIEGSPGGEMAGQVRVLVDHFSVHGAGYGTTDDLSRLVYHYAAIGLTAEQVQTVYDGMFAPEDAGEIDPAEARARYLRWFDALVLPLLQGADDDVSLLAAVRAFDEWVVANFRNLDEEDQAEWDAVSESIQAGIQERGLQWAAAAAPKIRQALQANNAVCAQERSLAALSNVQTWAQYTSLLGGVNLAALGLDEETIKANLCARMVITDLSLPDPLRSDVPSDLDVTYGLEFTGDIDTQAVPTRVEFSGVNAAFNKNSPANSNTLGDFTVGVRAEDASKPVTVFLSGCPVVGDQLITLACRDDYLTRNVTWTSPAVVRSGCCVENPLSASSFDGSSIVMWVEEGPAPDFNRDLYARRIDATGVTYTAERVSFSAYGIDVSSEALAMDSQGRALAVWSQSVGDNRRIFASRYVPGVGWSAPVRVQENIGDNLTDPVHQTYPLQIAMNEAGDAVVAWQDVSSTGTTRVFARRFTPADGWLPSQLLESSSTSVSPVVAIDASGAATVVWYGAGGAAKWARQQSGQSWSGAQTLGNVVTNGVRALAASPNGTLALLTRSGTSSASTVSVQRFDPVAGSWSAAEIVQTGAMTTQNFNPLVAVLDDGTVHAAWLQQPPGVSGMRLFATRRQPDGTWTTPQQIGRNAPTSIEYHAGGKMAVGASGEVHVAWGDIAVGVGNAPSVLVNRYVPGSGWGEPRIIDQENASTASLSAASSGLVTLAWMSFASPNFQVRVSRLQ